MYMKVMFLEYLELDQKVVDQEEERELHLSLVAEQ